MSRRRVLSRGALALGAAAAASAVASPSLAAGKVSQAQAGYKNAPQGGNECDKCQQFLPPSDCKVVDGPVSPQGSCTLFVAKAK